MKQLPRLFLLCFLIVSGSCNKEKTLPLVPENQMNIHSVSPGLYLTSAPIDFVSDEEIKNLHSAGVTMERGDGYYFTIPTGNAIAPDGGETSGAQVYPNDNGQCKLIFRRWDSQNCGSCAFPYAIVRCRDGIGGTILASYNVSLSQGWIELNVPQTCAITIQIDCGGLTGGADDRDGSACQYRIQAAEYGWNQGGVFGWVPTGVEVYYFFRRFPPKGMFGYSYSHYLCDSWCTWNARLAIGNANPSPATYSFGCGYQTYGALGSTIKYYQITQDENSTQNRSIYPLDINSVYQFNATPTSPTTNQNTSLTCTVSGGGIGVPISSVTFGWGTDSRVGCVNGCGIYYVE